MICVRMCLLLVSASHIQLALECSLHFCVLSLYNLCIENSVFIFGAHSLYAFVFRMSVHVFVLS